MKLKDYLEDKTVSVLLGAGAITLTLAIVFLYSANLDLTFLISLVLIIPLVLVFFINYYKRSKQYQRFSDTLNQLDQKYLVHELILKIDTNHEGALLKQFLYEIDKSMLEHINTYIESNNDLITFIEMWVHEVKIPLASAQLVIDNHQNELNPEIDDALKRINNDVEQALYYFKSSNLEKDYLIRRCQLSDAKWLRFIINQIIANAVKYHQEKQPLIKIKAESNQEGVSLTIYDNGVGIATEDINQVFEPGFTGKNGRIIQSSTGIGLYLCKKLCDKLYHQIEIESELGEYTCVKIFFPKGRMTEMD